MKIADLLTEGITPEGVRHRNAKYTSARKKPIITGEEKGPVKFEKEVRSYLFENRDKLDIKSLYTLNNILLDGAIRLNDGRLILLEFKYILNWHLARNARAEVQRFMAKKLYAKFPELCNPERALIIFKAFSGDWDVTPNCRKHKNGWSRFYEEENVLRRELNLMPIDIAQLTEKGLYNPLI